MVGVNPCLPASLPTRLASDSAFPVCEPNRMVSGSNGLVSGISDRRFEIGEAGAREKSPARKPFKYARCSGVNGAFSGRTGTKLFIGDSGHQQANTKHQRPNTKKAPSAKSQIANVERLNFEF